MKYTDSLLKLDWADKHIRDIQVRVEGLPDSNIATVDVNPEFGNEFIKYDLNDPSATTDLALMIGDAIHNLKCALDYAWLQTIERLAPSAVSKFAKFPVYPSRNDLEIALTGREIHVSSAELFDLMLDVIRPYDGGNEILWIVHRLNIRDKHRLLLPVIHYASISGIETQDEKGEVSTAYTAGTMQPPPWYIPIPKGLKVKNKGKPSFSVLFGEGTPARHLNVQYALSIYLIEIRKVVERLEAL